MAKLKALERKFSWKLLVATVIATMILTASVAHYVSSTPGVTPDIYLDDYPATAYYVVKTDGVNEWVVRYDGRIVYDGTSDATVINWALSNLPSGRDWQAAVLLRGDFTIASTILVYSFTHLTLEGQITLGSGADCDMLQNGDAKFEYVTIEGGKWHGNYYGQGGNYCGFNITVTQSSDAWNRRLEILNLDIIEVGKHAIRVRAESGIVGVEPFMDIVTARCPVGGGYGIYTSNVGDCVMTNIDAGAQDVPAIFLEANGGGSLTGFRTDGAVKITYTKVFAVNGFFIDLTNRDLDGIELAHCCNVQIGDGTIRAGSDSGYNTKAGIKIVTGYEDSGLHNQVSNVYIGRNTGATGTQRFAYGILEVDGTYDPNYNLYCNIDANDTLNGNLLVGANSSIVNSLP